MSDMPPSPARDTRSMILEAFADELCAGGYLGVSLDSVAKATGIKKASLYHHFPGGKEEIYRETALAEFVRQASYVQEALAMTGSLEDELVRIALVRCGSPDARPELDQQLYEATRHVSDETRTQVSTVYLSSLIAPVEALFARAVDAGELLGDGSFLTWRFLEMAASVTPMPDDLGMPPEHRGPTPRADAAARAVVRLFLDGARPR